MNINELFGIDIPEEVTEETKASVMAQIESKYKEQFLNSDDFLKSIPIEKIVDLKGLENQKFNEAKLAIMATQSREVDKLYSITEEEKKLFTEEEKKDAHKYLRKAYEISAKKQGGDKELLLGMQTKLAEYEQKMESKDQEWQSKIAEIENSKNDFMTRVQTKHTLAAINQANFKDRILGDVNSMFDLIYVKIEQEAKLKTIDGQIFPTDDKGLKIPKQGKVGEFMTVVDYLESKYKELGVIKAEKAPDGRVDIPIDGKGATNYKYNKNASRLLED
jgi:hypothetical protein